MFKNALAETIGFACFILVLALIFFIFHFILNDFIVKVLSHLKMAKFSYFEEFGFYMFIIFLQAPFFYIGSQLGKIKKGDKEQ